MLSVKEILPFAIFVCLFTLTFIPTIRANRKRFPERTPDLDLIEDPKILRLAEHELPMSIGAKPSMVVIAQFMRSHGHTERSMADLVQYLMDHEINASFRTNSGGLPAGLFASAEVFYLECAQDQVVAAEEILRKKSKIEQMGLKVIQNNFD
ncbi:MAG: hypothetical protein JWQ35_1746 [Bacteriovoracaceae bacterium]|nr:hypothetical protein [Bacteriovoracaceae bacterium]